MTRGSLLLVIVYASSCSTCSGPDILTDFSCHPGNPAVGNYDQTLPELCNNDIDDNCDGHVNEGCDCRDGETATCGSNVGACQSSEVVCQGGKWPDCVPTQVPITETCNNIDDDCDGVTDNNIAEKPCWTGSKEAVFGGASACKPGLTSCTAGAEACKGQIMPSQETCNNIDDDCDGTIDNDSVDSTANCGPGNNTGACVYGHLMCHNGEILCSGAVYPITETCNGRDDNCDGNTDEGLFQQCHTICGSGYETCNNGSWVDCSAAQPTPEVCNGLDDDCNGIKDDGIDCLCVNGTAEICHENIVNRDTMMGVSCGRGIHECINGAYGPCFFFDTTSEVCNDWDDDCDGVVDNFSVECGAPQNAVGICKAGHKTCTAGQWSNCEGSVMPRLETCNGLDDDCDGLTDENLNQHTSVDMIFAMDISGSMCPYISQLRQAMGAYSIEFHNTTHRFALAVFPGYGNVNPRHFVPGPGTYMSIVTDFVPVEEFQLALSTIDCNGYAEEPSIDVFYRLSNAFNPEQVNWRASAFPYIIIITDEEGQTWEGRTIENVAAQTRNCQIAGCHSGDKIESFVLTHEEFFTQWSPVVFNETPRLIELDPADEDRYVTVFQSIFSDVCR